MNPDTKTFNSTGPALGLGLDAGGTHTRWALASASGQVLASGELPPLSGQQLASEAGRQQLVHTLQQLAQRAWAAAPRPVQALVAGITGFDAQAMPQWQALAAQALGLPLAQVRALGDIELACAAAFAPGQGVVLIAGTGSIAAHVDALGVLHRAGGRGAVIDDAGGGHWVAREALCHIWRAEDLQPGSWQASRLARLVFAHIGGSSWAHTRQWVYGATRGELGTLALAVAQAALDGGADPPPPAGLCMDAAGAPPAVANHTASADPAAVAILQRAGTELARLVQALHQRLGAQPVALAGRVWDLHPLLESSLRQALPPGLPVQRLLTPAHHAAARLAAAAAPQSAPRAAP